MKKYVRFVSKDDNIGMFIMYGRSLLKLPVGFCERVEPLFCWFDCRMLVWSNKTSKDKVYTSWFKASSRLYIRQARRLAKLLAEKFDVYELTTHDIENTDDVVYEDEQQIVIETKK